MSCSRPTMAKDVIKKKQRIAHNKTNECPEMYPECDDILTSIMQDMDNTNLMPALCLNNMLQPNLSETSKMIFQEKVQSSVFQIPGRSLSSLPKLKKLGLTRKGPLMEKSQRILKQLQHNRKQPKPRAHLAGFNSQSSEKSLTKVMYNARVINKFQNKAATIKQVYNRAAADRQKNSVEEPKSKEIFSKKQKCPVEEPKSKEIIFKKLRPSVMEKKCPVEESCRIVENVCKKQESAIEKKCSPEKSSEKINNCDKYGDNSSDSDEYEKFIRKEKKDLPKNPKRKTSNNIKSQSVLKVSRKRFSKSVSSESESDDLSDEESSNSHQSKKMRKPSTNAVTNKVSKKCISRAKSDSEPTSDDSRESSNSLNSKKRRKTHDVLNNGQSKSSIKNKVLKNVNKKCIARTEYVSSSRDSEMSDDEQRPSTSYKRGRKVRKKINDGLSDTSEDFETGMGDVNDGTYHNSSSESDDLPAPSELMHGSPSNSNQSSGQIGNQRKTELSVHSNKVYNIPSSRDEPNILCNKTSVVNSNEQNILQNETSSYEMPDIASIGSKDQPNALHESFETNSLVHSANHNILRKTCDLPSLGRVSIKTECVDRQNNFVSNTTREENSPKSVIIDLVESDNECDSSFTVLPKIVTISSHSQNDSESSEESEIELVDVIVPPDPPVSAKRSHRNVPFSKNSANELNIKTEKVNETTLSTTNLHSAKSNPESQTPLIRKNYEVAYSTGICQKPDEGKESKEKVRNQLCLNSEKSQTGDNIVKQPSLNNELQNVISHAKDSLISNKVKKEPCDDLEIILDTASSSNSAIHLSNKQLHKSKDIKVEKDSPALKQTVAIPDVNADPIGAKENSVEAKDLLIPNKKVKKEPDSDECEIILDIASTYNSKNLSSVQMHDDRSIKVESDLKGVPSKSKAIHIANDGPIGTKENSSLTEKGQRLHDNPHTAFTSLTGSHNKIVQPSESELNALSIKIMLENLKKEFATYQEIIVTEQSVETTFKLLERCQAERLQSIKTQIIQYLESLPSNSDNNSLKNEMHKLLDSSDSLKDGPNVSSACPSDSSSTSDISMKDLKTLATMNLVPLSSIPEKDIKPNLSELQYALKQEQSPSYEMNSMSFGEKCIVCKRDASAACQQCAKVFFCSNDCGMKYWEDGHKNTCVK